MNYKAQAFEISKMAVHINKLKAENAKLRELVSLYHYGATHEASPSDVLAWSAKVDSLRRELGIEEEVAE